MPTGMSFAMQSEYDRSQFDQEPHTFEEADAILEIQMPTYLNGMRLKAAGMGTSDASLNDCRTSIRVRMTQQQIMEIDAGDCRFKAPQKQRGGEPILRSKRWRSMSNISIRCWSSKRG